jgi:cytochrome P450
MDGKADDYRTASHPTIFHELLSSNLLSPEEKSIPRLAEEGETVVGAGTNTTAHMLKLTSFHLLANPEILQKLKAELASATPNSGTPVPLRQLEQLPYLSGVVNEGLRMSYGVSSRLARVSPDSTLVFKEWEIPPWTPVSMTSVLMHENPKYFPEPSVFRPERWLEGNSEKRLEKYLVPFSKGTRACAGMNLAYAEIYLTLAAMFGQFEMELYETTREDVDVVHDFFNPSARLDSKGVRVLVK